jgi:hypothetical protein
VSIFLALIHHPVLNRHGEVSSTAVTNVDIHDLARAGRTYGVARFFIVTPIELQQELIGRVVRHWAEGAGGARIPTRKDAFSRCEIAASIDDALARVEAIAGRPPKLAVTGAHLSVDVTPFEEVRRQLDDEPDEPILLLLGTGYGLAPEVMDRANIRLPAVSGPPEAEGYNHLSVRAAAVIILDRLRGC